MKKLVAILVLMASSIVGATTPAPIINGDVKAVQEFVDLWESKNSKAVIELLSPNVEFVDDVGTKFSGQSALIKRLSLYSGRWDFLPATSGQITLNQPGGTLVIREAFLVSPPKGLSGFGQHAVAFRVRDSLITRMWLVR